MKVLAIDFETANSKPESACSLGYCLWSQGEIIDSQEILIRPHQSVNYFQYQNVRIHEITPEMVEFCDEWPMVFWQIKDYFNDSLVIAHNARFDIGVLRSINKLYGIEMNDFPYLDTVEISRAIHPYLENHKLNTVAEYLDIDLQHHHAKSDAFGCLAILENAMETYGEYDVQELIARMFLNYKHYLK